MSAARANRPLEAETTQLLDKLEAMISRPCCSVQHGTLISSIGGPAARAPEPSVPLRWGEPRRQPKKSPPRPLASARYAPLAQAEEAAVEASTSLPSAARSSLEPSTLKAVAAAGVVKGAARARATAHGVKNMLGQLRRRVVVTRMLGKLTAAARKRTESKEGLEDDAKAYYEIAQQKVVSGASISRLLEEKKPPSIKHEETEVVHRIEEEEHPGVEYDIPEDSYGAAILAIIKEVQQFAPGGSCSSRIRGGFAVVLLTVNLMLQWGILSFIDVHVVEPAVHAVQSIFEDYHRHSFDRSGNFRPELWAAYEGKQELCTLGAVSGFFHRVVLFVWVTAMLSEFRTTYYMMRNISRMPRCSQPNMMLVATSQNVCIVALTLGTRLLLYILVCAPKFVISSYLLTLGCQWLSASASFEALVLNSVAMEFVLHIDELLYHAFVPVEYRKQVADINFFVRQARRSQEEETRKALLSYALSMLYLLGGLFVMLFYVTFLEDSFPHDVGAVEIHCQEYIQGKNSPLCTGWGWSQDVESCYPYGNASRPARVRHPSAAGPRIAGPAG